MSKQTSIRVSEYTQQRIRRISKKLNLNYNDSISLCIDIAESADYNNLNTSNVLSHIVQNENKKIINSLKNIKNTMLKEFESIDLQIETLQIKNFQNENILNQIKEKL